MVCNERKQCFAKVKIDQESYGCSILQGKEIPEGKCHFCKEKRNVTNGITYIYGKER